MKKTLFALLFAACSALPALAQIETQKAGDWTVQTRHDDPTVDPSCVLVSPKTDSDVRLQLTNPVRLKGEASEAGNAALAIYVQTDERRETVTLPQVKFKIDRRAEWSANVVLKPIDTGYAFTAILDADIRKILRPMALGNSLQVTYTLDGQPEEQKSVSLSGSSAALALYEECLSKVQVK
ncbi:MAG: hypothetical protein WCC66_05315 [Rhizobiaceae bacterium]